ncbi:hypothetical protein EDD18DRAFT_1435217 [Armillaria luteobubalina]|uniref:Fork-head domain-containing protein n=1 Tax=Armillaria luteobubalina TaxID=153913 RepID=A0AA39UWT7_9AGAR|nr:hypothetical protein EDD18DRAFT_1435217 [Armillaria luteobubalina]
MAREDEDQPFMPGSGGGIKTQDPDSPLLAPSPSEAGSPGASVPGSPPDDEMLAHSPEPDYVHEGQPGPPRTYDASGYPRGRDDEAALSQRGSHSPPSEYSLPSGPYPPGYATAITGLPSPFASLDPGPRYYRRHTLEQSPQTIPKRESPDSTPFLARADTQYDLPEPGDYLREFLNLPRGTAVRLENLVNPRDRAGRPPYTIIQLAAAAIYSHPHQKASTAEIRAAIIARFEYFQENQGTLRETLKHALSSHDLFRNMGRTVTEPGRGGLWAIDITNPEGRRPRKRGPRSTQSPLDEGSSGEASGSS